MRYTDEEFFKRLDEIEDAPDSDLDNFIAQINANPPYSSEAPSIAQASQPQSETTRLPSLGMTSREPQPPSTSQRLPRISSTTALSPPSAALSGDPSFAETGRGRSPQTRAHERGKTKRKAPSPVPDSSTKRKREEHVLDKVSHNGTNLRGLMNNTAHTTDNISKCCADDESSDRCAANVHDTIDDSCAQSGNDMLRKSPTSRQPQNDQPSTGDNRNLLLENAIQSPSSSHCQVMYPKASKDGLPGMMPQHLETSKIASFTEPKHAKPPITDIDVVGDKLALSQSLSRASSVDTEANSSVLTSPGNSPQLRGTRSLTEAADAEPQSRPKRGKKPANHKASTLAPPVPVVRLGKGKKQPKELISPLEWAQRLRQHWLTKRESDSVQQGSNQNLCLKGHKIFYYGAEANFVSEATRRRTELIWQYGAEVLPEYDVHQVTVIVVDKEAKARSTLRALKLKSLKDIPDHIPIVKWDWVVRSANRKEAYADYGHYAVFSSKIYDLGANFQKPPTVPSPHPQPQAVGIGDEGEVSGDFSRISDFSVDSTSGTATTHALQEPLANTSSRARQAPSLSLPHSDSPRYPSTSHVVRDNEDPLAPFYEEARTIVFGDDHERDGHSGENTESDSDIAEAHGRNEISAVVAETPLRRGYACDQPKNNTAGHKCANQDIVDKLEELKALHEAKGTDDDMWRVHALRKAVAHLRAMSSRLKSPEDALKLPGVGEKTKLKIKEIMETGGLRRIAHETTEDIEAMKIFQGIYGVGRSTARQWYNAGYRTLDDIKQAADRIKLSSAQTTGLQYYDDINSRMPREEASAIFELIKPIALEMDPGLFIEIMGSYRRGKADCGDIDILITRNHALDGRTHAGFLPRLLSRLKNASILTEDLTVPGPEADYELDLVYRGLCRLPHVASSRRRRIDFLAVPWQSKGAALLYYTGDDMFNRSMRLKANHDGKSLNQLGLFDNVIRNPSNRREKLNPGRRIAGETEQEIFALIGVPWQEPHQRVRK